MAHDRVLKVKGLVTTVTSLREHDNLYFAPVYLFMFEGLNRYWSRSRNMPHRYVVERCSNVRSSENGIALHTIPLYGDERLEAKKRRKRWIEFVRQKRAGWDPSKSSVRQTTLFTTP